MEAMAWTDQLPVFTDPLDVASIVKTKFQIRRSVLNGKDVHRLHDKIACVDRKVLYFGSDNAYPQYNQQFGVWIEDEKSIETWIGGYYDGLWQRATPDAAV